MKTQTVNSSDRVAENFYKQILAMEEQIAKMKKQWEKLFAPKYGSGDWWEKEEKEADEDIKAGRVYVLHDTNDLDKPLSKLKPWK